MWTIFLNSLSQLIEKHVPEQKSVKTTKTKNLWITKSTKKKMKKRSVAWKKYTRYKSDENYRSYKEIRNETNRMVNNDQKLHRKKLIASFQRNDKRFYGYIRKLQTRPVEVT